MSTVTTAGVVRVMTYEQTRTAALFLVFLGRWWHRTTGQIVRSVDQRRAHGTPEVLDGLADQQQQIEMYYWPRYAPERNATAYRTNNRKGQVHAAGWPDNQAGLRWRRQQFRRRLPQLPQKVRNYFKHPCMLYAMPHEA